MRITSQGQIAYCLPKQEQPKVVTLKAESVWNKLER